MQASFSFHQSTNLQSQRDQFLRAVVLSMLLFQTPRTHLPGGKRPWGSRGPWRVTAAELQVPPLIITGNRGGPQRNVVSRVVWSFPPGLVSHEPLRQRHRARPRKERTPRWLGEPFSPGGTQRNRCAGTSLLVPLVFVSTRCLQLQPTHAERNPSAAADLSSSRKAHAPPLRPTNPPPGRTYTIPSQTYVKAKAPPRRIGVRRTHHTAPGRSAPPAPR
jgi:hypothetical protein